MSFKSQGTFFRPTADAINRSINASSQQSASMPVGAECARIQYAATTPGAACYIVIGVNPTAAANTGLRLTDGATEYFKVNPGEKVAVIGVDGNLNITPMGK